MAKKQEDNRDVFDKALDYAPAAGAVLGGVLGVKAGKKLSAMKKAGDLQNIERAERDLLKKWLEAKDDRSRARVFRDLDRVQRQGSQIRSKIRNRETSVGSRVAGGVAGAYSGALAGATARNNYESKGRRK